MSQIDIALDGGTARNTTRQAAGPNREESAVRGTARFGGGTGARATALAAAAAFLVLALAPCSREADAALIAAWNLNGLDPAGARIVTASAGNGTLDATALGAGFTVMQGTTVGAQPGDAAGDALALVGNGFNRSSFEFSFDTAGQRDLVLTFAARRSTTGFATNRIEWWTGAGWTTLTAFGASTTAWELQSHSLAAATASLGGTVALRVVLDGATGSTGSIRFDNLAVTSTPVPSPAGAAALAGFAGCLTGRRRRRAA